MPNSVNIPPEVVKQVLDYLTQATTLLQPYLISLTPEERHDIPKMADKSVAFVTKALNFAESNPKYAPQDLDIPALHNDVQTVSDLHSIENPLLILGGLLHDSIIGTGSSAYILSLAYYDAVQSAAKRNVPGAEAIYNELKVRFEQMKKKPA